MLKIKIVCILWNCHTEEVFLQQIDCGSSTDQQCICCKKIRGFAPVYTKGMLEEIGIRFLRTAVKESIPEKS